jgi:hypothetical protein
LTSPRRITLTLGAAVGGLLGAAFLPMAVALADDIGAVPDPSTFSATTVEGFPPFYTEETGTEFWSLDDFTTGMPSPLVLSGEDTQTTFGSFTNDDFLITFFTLQGFPVGTQFDFANLGSGFANEWVDIPGTGTGAGVSDLLITPFGDLSLLGTLF